MTDPNQSPELPSDILEQFAAEYRKTVPEKIEKIQALLEQLRTKIDEENLKALRMHIHKIAGSAGTYGFTKVSEISIKFEKDLLDKIDHLKEVPGSPEWIKGFESYFDDIKKGFQK